MKSVLAIDIGGTKIAVGVVDAEGVLSCRFQAMTPIEGTAQELLLVLEGLFDAIENDLDSAGGIDSVRACGVGCGGPMKGGGRLFLRGKSEDGAVVSPLNIPGWRNFALSAEVARLTGLPTIVDNDAKAFALGEGWVGAAHGQSNFIGMVVSTGVGGGIVLNGRLLDGAAGNAGHIGQMVVNPYGHQPPGQIRGVLEAECSGTSIAEWFGSAASEAPRWVRRRTGHLVGQAVGSVANLLDLDLAVVGGSVALGFGDDFLISAQEEIDRICALDYSRGTRIIRAGNGDASPLIGAGALAFRALGMRLGAVLPGGETFGG